MKRYKHPKFGAIVTDSETVNFDYEWNGRARFAPVPVTAPLPKIAPKPTRPRKTAIRHESKQRLENMTLVSRNQETPMFSGDYEVRQPIRERQIMSEVGVPVLQSVVTGVFAAGASYFIFGGVDWFVSKFVPHLAFIAETIRWFHWLVLSGAIGWFVAGMDWVDMRKRLDDLLYLVERVAGQDLNNDGEVGYPDAPRTVDVVTKHGRQPIEIKGQKSTVSSKVWVEFATAVLCDGVLISKNAICGITTISQPNYLSIFGELAESSFLISEKGKSNQLTRAGYDYLARYVPSGREITLPYPY